MAWQLPEGLIALKRVFMIVAVLLTPGCSNPVAPSPVHPAYFLSAVDGQLLPVPFAADGSVLLAGSLGFGDWGRPRETGPVTGTVAYGIILRRPDQSLEHSTVQLDYSISDGVLRINLCPPLALCIVSTELVGPILSRTSELVLTHFLSGTPGSVYRYFPSLPD